MGVKEADSDVAANEDFCLECGEGGELVCCDACPKAYHVGCCDITAEQLKSDDEWLCAKCRPKRAKTTSQPGLSSERQANNAVDGDDDDDDGDDGDEDGDDHNHDGVVPPGDEPARASGRGSSTKMARTSEGSPAPMTATTASASSTSALAASATNTASAANRVASGRGSQGEEEGGGQNGVEQREALALHDGRCTFCNQTGQVLDCTGCSKAFHAYCALLEIEEVSTRTSWYCETCVQSGISISKTVEGAEKHNQQNESDLQSILRKVDVDRIKSGRSLSNSAVRKTSRPNPRQRVRGPTSALSSFLREKGISAPNRGARWARSQRANDDDDDDDDNNNDDDDDDDDDDDVAVRRTTRRSGAAATSSSAAKRRKEKEKQQARKQKEKEKQRQRKERQREAVLRATRRVAEEAKRQAETDEGNKDEVDDDDGDGDEDNNKGGPDAVRNDRSSATTATRSSSRRRGRRTRAKAASKADASHDKADGDGGAACAGTGRSRRRPQTARTQRTRTGGGGGDGDDGDDSSDSDFAGGDASTSDEEDWLPSQRERCGRCGLCGQRVAKGQVLCLSCLKDNGASANNKSTRGNSNGRKPAPKAAAGTGAVAAAAAGGGGGRKRNKRAATGSLLHELRGGSLTSLQDLCVRFVVRHIDAVTDFGDIADDALDRICAVICKQNRLTDQTIKLFVKPERQHLQLFDCANLSPQSYHDLFVICGALSSLTLDLCGQLDDDRVLMIPKCSPLISELRLTGAFKVTDTVMAAVVKELSLRRFAFCSSNTLADKTLQALSKQTGLEEVLLKQCLKVSDAEVAALSSLKRLKSLSLIQCELITDRGLIAVLEAVGPSLTELNVHGLAQLTDRAVLTIARKCHNLRVLNLSHLPEITDESVAKLADACSQLRELNLSRCVELTDDSVVPLLDNNPRLTQVSLHSLDKLSPAVAQSLCKLRELERVNVSLCRNMDVTDEFVDAVLQHCPKLQKVTAWACLRLTEVSLRPRPTHPSFALVGCATVL